MDALLQNAQSMASSFEGEVDASSYLADLVGNPVFHYLGKPFLPADIVLSGQGVIPAVLARARSLSCIIFGEGKTSMVFEGCRPQPSASAMLRVEVNMPRFRSDTASMLRLIFLGNSAIQLLSPLQRSTGEYEMSPLIGHYQSPVFLQTLLGQEYEIPHTPDVLRSLFLGQAMRPAPQLFGATS